MVEDEKAQFEDGWSMTSITLVHLTFNVTENELQDMNATGGLRVLQFE